MFMLNKYSSYCVGQAGSVKPGRAGKWEGNELFISLVLESSFDNMRRGVLFVSSVHIIFAQEQTDLYLCMYNVLSSYVVFFGSAWHTKRNYGKSSRKAFSFYLANERGQRRR